MAGAPGDDAPPTVAIRPQFDWDAAADGTPVQRRAAEPVCLDAASVASTPGQLTGTQLVVLCTGHGSHGQAAAVLSAQQLAQDLSNALAAETSSTASALDRAVFERAFVSCHSELCASAGLDASHSGASALALVLAAGQPGAPDGRIVAASAGNCRAVLARAHSDAIHPDHHSPSPTSDQSAMAAALDAIQLSADALLDAPLERCRVEAHGARVENLPLTATGPAAAAAAAAPSSSCCQRLALWEGGSVVEAPASRLLGCTAAQAAGVIALPVVLRWRRCAALDKFIIVGSEGMWRAFSNEEAVEFVQRYCEAAAAATAAGAAAAGGYSLGVADALTLEAQERLKLRQARAVVPDVTAIVLPLAPEYSVSTGGCKDAAGAAQQATTAGGTQEQNGVACGAAANASQLLPAAARSNAEAGLLARNWAAEPHSCPASAAAAAPFPALLPHLRSHPWPTTPASMAVGRLLRRVPPPRRSSLGFGFALSRRQSSELELSRDTEWSSDSNVSFTSEEQVVVLHKVRLNGHLSGPPEMESMLYGSATSGRPDTTVARHLGPPSPMPRAQSINVSQLSLATSRRANNSSGGLASSTAGVLGYSQGFGDGYGQGFGNYSQGSLSTASAPPFSTNSLRKARSYQALAALATTSSAHLQTQSSSSAPASDTTHSLAAAAHGTSKVANSAAVPGNAAGPMFPAFRSAFAAAGSEAMAALGGAASGYYSSGKGRAANSSSAGTRASADSGVISSSGAVLGSSSGGINGRSSTEPFPGLLEAEQAAAVASLVNSEQQRQPRNAYTRMAASVRQLLSATGSSAPGSPLSSAADGAAGSDHAPQQSLGLWQGWQGQQAQQGQQEQQAQQGQQEQQTALQRLQGLQLLLPQAAAQGSWASSGALQAGPGSNIDSEDHVSSPVGSTSSAAASDRVHALAEDLAHMDNKKAWRNRPEPCVHNGMRKGYLPRHTSMPSLTHHYSTDSEPQLAASAAAYVRHSADSTQPQTAARAAESNKPWVRPPPLLVVAQHVPTAPGSPLSFGALSAPHAMERTQSARARRALTHDMSSASLSESLVGSQAAVESPVGQGSGFEVSGHQVTAQGEQRQQELAFAGAFAPHADVGSFEVGSPREEGQVHAGKPHGSASSTTSMEVSLSQSLPSRQYARSASFSVGSPAEEHKVHGGVPCGSACSTPIGDASQQQHTRRAPSRALSFPQPGGTRALRTAPAPPAPTAAIPTATAAPAATTLPVSGSIEHLLTYQGSITKVHLQQQPSAARARSVPLDFDALADAAAAVVAAKAATATAPEGGSVATQGSGPSSVLSSAATSAAASTASGASNAATEAALLDAPSPTSGNSSGSSGGTGQGRLEKSLLPPVWTALQPGMQGVSAASSFGSTGTAAGAATNGTLAAAQVEAAQAAATQALPAHAAAPMAVPIGSSAPALLSHSRSAMSAPASVSFQKHSHIMQLPVLQESDSETDATSDSEADNASDSDSSGRVSSSPSLSRPFVHPTSDPQHPAGVGTLQVAPLSHLPPHILSEARPRRSPPSTSSMESFGEATFDCNTTSSSTCRQADTFMTEEGDSAIPSHEVSYQVSNQAADEAANDADAAHGAADADASSPGRLRVRSFEFSRHHTLDQQHRSSAHANASPPRVFGKPTSRFSASAPVLTSADVLLAAAATAAGDVGEAGARPALQLGSAFGTGDSQGFGTGDASAVGAGDTCSYGMRSARGFRSPFGSSGALVSRGLGSLGPAGLLWDGGEEGRVHRGSSLSLLLQQGLQAMTELDVLGECGEGSRTAGSASMAPATAY